MLPRLQLFEWMDHPHLPVALRQGLTESLRGAEALVRLHDPLLPLLAERLSAVPERRIVDLASGAGGPIERLFPVLHEEGHAHGLLLTDRYPAADEVVGPGVSWDAAPVEATRPPEGGLLTMFNASHHLRPDELRGLLAVAAGRGQPILLVESLSRTPQALVASVGLALMIWVAAPIFRPFRWSRVLLCWPVPVLPALVLWESVVSCLRCYSREELKRMAPTRAGYRWKAGVVRTGWIGARLSWFAGAPER